MSGFTIEGSLCKKCGRVIVPPRETCPYCGMKAGPMEIQELRNMGIVQSYTTLMMPPEGFKAPLMMALVELEYGALILCLARDIDSLVRIGDNVEVTIDSDGRFQYHPIK
ncbi:MAG: Zn-ribbon domain-containing OB-fold protein [Candidatus Thorarchaeota archaeon]